MKECHHIWLHLLFLKLTILVKSVFALLTIILCVDDMDCKSRSPGSRREGYSKAGSEQGRKEGREEEGSKEGMKKKGRKEGMKGRKE